MSEPKQNFGPFLIPASHALDIKPSGFVCPDCKEPVRKLAKVLPAMVPRGVFYNCKCGTVFVWEDEAQPRSSKHWRSNMKLLRQTGSDLVVFNGNKPLKPSFSGLQ
jgi:hypothetical protein